MYNVINGFFWKKGDVQSDQRLFLGKKAGVRSEQRLFWGKGGECTK